MMKGEIIVELNRRIEEAHDNSEFVPHEVVEELESFYEWLVDRYYR